MLMLRGITKPLWSTASHGGRPVVVNAHDAFTSKHACMIRGHVQFAGTSECCGFSILNPTWRMAVSFEQYNERKPSPNGEEYHIAPRTGGVHHTRVVVISPVSNP